MGLFSDRKNNVALVSSNSGDEIVDESHLIEQRVRRVSVAGDVARARGERPRSVATGDDLVPSASKRTDHGQRTALFRVSYKNPHECLEPNAAT